MNAEQNGKMGREQGNCYHCENFPKCFKRQQVIEMTGYRDKEPVYIPSANATCIKEE